MLQQNQYPYILYKNLYCIAKIQKKYHPSKEKTDFSSIFNKKVLFLQLNK
jgi:hypothetical protein